MDNAATTKVAPQVLDAMLPYFSEIYANGSSVYQFGQTAKEAIENARAQAAALIGARPEEIYFTGGGSESDNWAIKNAAEVYGNKGKHIITSNIEHHAVLHTCQYLEKHGFEVTYLPVDSEGRITPEQLEAGIPANMDEMLAFADNYDAPENVEAVLRWDVSDIFYNYFFSIYVHISLVGEINFLDNSFVNLSFFHKSSIK